MQKALSVFGINLKPAVFVAGLFLLSAGLFLTPRLLEVSHADVCNGAPDGVDFNHFPITYTGEACKDFPTVTLRRTDGQYPTDLNQFSQGVQAQAGDTVYVRLWVHNGAVTGGETANNVTVNVNVPTDNSGNYPISATISADNDHGRGASGSETIHTNPGETLQVVAGSLQFFDDQGNPINPPGGFRQTGPTTFHFDNWQACFEFAKFIRFAVQVVPAAQPQPQQPSGHLTANLGNQCINGFDPNTSISWTTNNVTFSEIDVADQNGNNPTVLGQNNTPSGNSGPLSWIKVGTTYTFILYDWDGGQKVELNRITVLSNATCQQPVTPTPTGHLTANLGNQCINGFDPNTSVGWTTTNVTFSELDIADQNGNNPKVVGQMNTAQGNTGPLSYIKVGTTYTFILYDWDGGQKVELDRITVLSNANCQPQQQTFTATATATASASATASCPDGTKATATASASATASATSTVSQQDAQNKAQSQAQQQAQASANAQAQANANVSCPNNPTPQPKQFTVSVNNFCVGQAAQYQFVGSANLAGQQINAQSYFTPTGGSQQNLGSTSVGTMQTATNGSSFFTTGHTWQTSDIGHWQRIFTIDGAPSQTANFDVVNCNPTPALMCNPGPTQTAAINQAIYFVATGGSGSYTWSAPNSTRTSGSGSNFNTSYNNSGDYTVSVSDGNTSAACGVHVNPPQYQQLQCMPPFQNANANATVYFSATGGNGSYTWSAPNSNQVSGSGSNFTTSYNQNSGYQTVTVHSGDGQTASCNVQIITQQPQQLICSPVNQSVNQGQTVYFSAFGGTGNYNWSATNGQTGNGSNFNTIFNNVGQQSATVTSGSQTAICYVNVNPNYIPPQNGYLMINKWVAHINQNDFSSSITASNGDRVTYKIQITAQNGTVNNVTLNDYFSNGNASYINGSLRVDGSNTGDNFNSLNLGSLSSGQTKTVTFDAYVTAPSSQGQTQIVNTATASGQNAASVSATATVMINQQILGSNVNITQSKRAWNDTKNVDAQQQPAAKQDFITYTLVATNTGNSPANNFVITDDLSQVLPYADVTDFGGGSLNGNVISWPGQTVPAGGSVQVSFRVRVKYFLADNLSYTMTNTYGNTVTVRINTPQVLGAFIAPKTGADTMAFSFGGAAMGLYAVWKKKDWLMKLILN